MTEELHLSRAQVRAFDEFAIRTLGIPAAVLMENAGRQAAEHLLAALRVQCLSARRGAPPWAIAIACGRGNNGGDGYVLARHVFNAGHTVECVDVGSGSASGDATAQRAIVEGMGIAVRSAATPQELAALRERWTKADALVDALLGTGARGAPRGVVASAIEQLNSCDAPFKLALDLPSGLDADSGAASDACFAADLTVTFVARKQGFRAETAARFLGRVVVADIGVAPRACAAIVAPT